MKSKKTNRMNSINYVNYMNHIRVGTLSYFIDIFFYEVHIILNYMIELVNVNNDKYL